MENNQKTNPSEIDEKKRRDEAKKKKTDQHLDEEIEQSFPASDPPSCSQPHNDENDKK